MCCCERAEWGPSSQAASWRLGLVGRDETPPPWELTKTDAPAVLPVPLQQTAPVPEERPTSDEPEDIPISPRQTRRGQVRVVVEPDPQWRKRLQQAMAAEGDTVYAAADAAERIRLFRTHKAECHVIAGFSSEPSEMQPIVQALQQAILEALFVYIGVATNK